MLKFCWYDIDVVMNRQVLSAYCLLCIEIDRYPTTTRTSNSMKFIFDSYVPRNPELAQPI